MVAENSKRRSSHQISINNRNNYVLHGDICRNYFTHWDDHIPCFLFPYNGKNKFGASTRVTVLW